MYNQFLLLIVGSAMLTLSLSRFSWIYKPLLSVRFVSFAQHGGLCGSRL